MSTEQSDAVKNAVDLFNDYKETEEYSEYLEGLQKDFPEIFKSSLELSIFTWWHEKVYKEYCTEKEIEWTSLLDEAENIIVEPAKGGETKAVESYTKSEWEAKFGHLEPIKGQVDMVIEPSTEFVLPNLEDFKIEPTLM